MSVEIHDKMIKLLAEVDELKAKETALQAEKQRHIDQIAQSESDLAKCNVTGTAAPPRLRRSAERDSHFDLLIRGALIPCIRPGMMPTLISVSR
jgi:hypothetical protein